MTKVIHANINKNIIIDTCYWFALYNSQDQYHKRATDTSPVLKEYKILIPWPTLYEVINTDFASNKIALTQFEILIKKPNIIQIDDKDYKANALFDTFQKSIYKSWPVSLVDSVIRQMVLDPKNKIDYLLTFNEGDFVDIVKKQKIQFYYSYHGSNFNF
ncbi:MAG: hypothetical protein HY738_00640 [Bacteroidia bacterium]|nr:hypothetical protein [Bacteroidia bacterium]